MIQGIGRNQEGKREKELVFRKEIYEMLDREHDVICDTPIDKMPSIVIGLGQGKVALALQIEEFLESLESDKIIPFELVRMKGSAPVLKVNEIGRYYSGVMLCALWDDLHHEFSEDVQLVMEGVRMLNVDPHALPNPTSQAELRGRYGFEYFNDLVAWLRTQLKDEAFVARRRRRREQARRHFLSAKTYIDLLFKRYARLTVLRIDLSYRDWTKPENSCTSVKTLHNARRDLARYFNNRRSNSIFDDLVGYIWKLEQGTTKGYHFHLLLFFDGSKVQKDAYRASLLGEYWQDVITRGEGLYYNCNAHKSKYRSLGIGRINHDDVELRSNLLLALEYLTKADQYLRVRGAGCRIFGKGVVKARQSAAGRPRQTPEFDTTAKVRAAPRIWTTPRGLGRDTAR